MPLDTSVKIVKHVIIATIRNVLAMVPVIMVGMRTRVIVIQDTRVQTVNTLIAIIINVLGMDLVRMEITDTRVGVTMGIWGKTARH